MRKTFFLNLLLFVIPYLFAQDDPAIRSGPITGGTGAAALTAAEEFRLGVHAYNRFAYNEAILSFERALSFRPGEAIILDWLGKGYYRSGLEDTAIRQWRSALDAYGRSSGVGMLINSRIETVTNRRSLLPVANDGVRYVEAGRYPAKQNDIVLYNQPTSLLPNNDGSVWVVGYGSNEIVKIDVNGIVRDRKRGPVNGFDRPYDMVRGVDGRLYVSEFRGGRVSVLNSNGDFQKYIGEKGLKAGQFSGPQNLTIDDSGYLYVVDFGNKRIAKYDPDGKFIVAFGQRSGQFQGLQSPTGIAARNNKIYAADSIAKTISVFDHNGNFLNQIAVEGLISPESLRFLSTGSLIVVDSNRILLVDPETAIARVLGIVGNEKMRLTCADMDSNGSILAVNFTVGEVSVMTRFDDLASGLFVQIRNVNAEKFPSVTVEFTVEDRQRRPIIGLDTNNFLLTENGNKASDQFFLSPGHKYSGSDIAFVVERSERTAGMRDELTALSRDVNRIIKDMKNTKIISLVSAGVQPRREQHDRSLENSMRGYESSYNPAWRFDLGLRLAATDLLTAASKRSVIYIGSGNLGDKAFEQYSLSELAGYLANNGIVFNAIIIGNAQISPGLDYLCVQTGGKAMRLFRPQGVAELFNNTTTIPSPLYTFTYTSKLPTDFGRSWLPVEIEAHLLERSGRDSTGYFPPLQ